MWAKPSTNCSRPGPSFSCIGSLQLLQAVELGVEHGSWHPHSLIAIERTEFVDVSIRLAANNCQPIEKGEIQLAVSPAQCAPNVPRHERHPVGRGNVLMNQQALHGLRERAGVARQAVE